MGLDIWLASDTRCNHCGRGCEDEELYSDNYTHNVVPMWKLAGVYNSLYRSDGKRAEDILPQLEAGLVAWTNDPKVYEALNPPNGWGDATGARKFLEGLISACHRHPKAFVRVWF